MAQRKKSEKKRKTSPKAKRSQGSRKRAESKRETGQSSAASTAYYHEEDLYLVPNSECASVSSFPLSGNEDLVARSERNSASPGGTVTWYLNGPTGSRFSTKLSFEGSGGHSHSTGNSDPRAAGTISPANGTLQGSHPQNLRQTYRAGQLCGEVRDTTVIGGTAVTKYVTIAAASLQPLAATTGVSLVGSTATHPSNHWGTSGLCTAIRQLGSDFQSEFGRPIYVNDMSLMTGGLFDIRGNFRDPHQTHREGRHVEINWSSMSAQQRVWFKSRAEALGFRVELHPNPTHWHLRY